MKRIHLFAVVVLTLITSIVASAQPRKSIEVTPQTITSLRADKPYVIDLTRNGKTYLVTASVANRVRIRTLKGKIALSDLVSNLKITSSKFLIGTASDLRALNFGLPPGTFPTASARNFTCSPNLPICECNGFGDCVALSFQCDVMLCVPSETPGKTICLCTKKPLPVPQ